MKSIKLTVLMLSTLLLTSIGLSSAHADILNPTGTIKKKLAGVKVHSNATATVNGDSYELTTLGAGIRKKPVNVYVAQLLSSHPTAFDRNDSNGNGALNSLSNMDVVAMKLDFLRNVPAKKISDSYVASLKKNNVNVADSNVKAFLDAVITGGPAKRGENLALIGAKHTDGTEVIIYAPAGKSPTMISGASTGFIKNIFSIWLGKTTDSKLLKLKKDILKGL